MKRLLLISLIQFFACHCMSQSNNQVKLDSLRNRQKELIRINAKIAAFSKSATRVRLIETCSTAPGLCGIFAFASSSVVYVESGMFHGDTLIVAALCNSTNYTFNKIYTLEAGLAPNFDVILCNNRSYYPGWNRDVDKNGWLLFFGTLKTNSLN